MRALHDILSSYSSNCLDGRDMNRLYGFIDWNTLQQYPALKEGIKEEYLNEEKWMSEVYEQEYTRENVLKQLERDVAFGFDKALDQRGISASLMYEVVKMWCWVLDDNEELYNWNSYAYYGLPLFKAVAVYYGFPNEIGDDDGDEEKYNN